MCACLVEQWCGHLRTLAGMSGGRASSQRRRLQRFVQQPQALTCFFQNWAGSVVRRIQQRQIVLVVDETKVKARFGVMVVGVVYEGRCIPLAWRVYRANSHADYPREGQARLIIRLLKAIRAGLPTGTQVRVLADRGIAALGWTFLFRVTKQSKLILPDGQAVCFYDQVTQSGESYSASGLVFKQRGRIPGHVRVVWGTQAQDRWALVTNDPALSGWEYAQRMWIEQAFRDLKSHGWQLDAVALTEPERLARLWVLLVVAYAWMLFLGAALLAAQRTLPLQRRRDGTLVRRWSLFREGRLAFLSADPYASS